MLMKISVVTACFNSDRTIKFAMESVRSQSYKNVEHIIIDGASTDNTLNIVKNFVSDGLKVISEPDGGIYDALNKGFGLASGDILGVLHSDDFFASEFTLSKVVDIFRDESIDVVYGDLQYVSKFSTKKIIRNWRAGEFSRSSLKWGWMLPHPTLFLRRSVFEGLKGFDLRYKISSDYDFIVRMLSQRDLTPFYYPAVIVCMRSGGVSNGSIGGVMRKSYEDYKIIRSNQIGGLKTLVCKNIRKISQFLF
ncbi:glycosyltransferase [Polynucleobacter paneuropaeus]|nr:glycosyltransferase [Polynucleobacter paneuropaeus]